MALLISVKNSQNEFVNTGFLFQGTWYVDESLTETADFVGGMEGGIFAAIGSGTSKCLVDGSENQATLRPATAVAVSNYPADGETLAQAKASGVIYKVSPRDRYGRADNMSDESRLFPYGTREDKAIGLLKKCVIEVSNPAIARYKHFTTKDVVTTATASAGALTDSSSELKIGDKVKDQAGAIGWVNGAATVTNDALSGALTKVCQMDDPVYLNTFADARNNTVGNKTVWGFEESSKLPFTTIPPETGALSQIVGYIESPVAVRIDLANDVNPEVVPASV